MLNYANEEDLSVNFASCFVFVKLSHSGERDLLGILTPSAQAARDLSACLQVAIYVL